VDAAIHRAVDELDRLRLDRWTTSTASRLTIVLPRSIAREGQQFDSLKALGLAKPRID
jgi:hypothetical protein